MRRITPVEEQCARGRSAAPLRSIGPSSVRMPSALEPATGGDQSTIKCKRSRSARRCPARWRCAVGSRSAERCGVAQRTALSCLLVSSPSSAASSARRCLPHCSPASRCLCRGRRCLPPSSTTSCSAQRIALLRKRSAWRCPAMRARHAALCLALFIPVISCHLAPCLLIASSAGRGPGGVKLPGVTIEKARPLPCRIAHGADDDDDDVSDSALTDAFWLRDEVSFRAR